MNRPIPTLLLCALAPLASAADIIEEKNIGMELARDIASETVLACRKTGYHVSAVVVDRHAILRAALRDDLAARFTLEIAERKANMTVMAWLDSGEFRKRRSDLRTDLESVDGLVVMEGGVKIVAGAEYGEVLGVHMIGPEVTELLGEVSVAMALDATVEDIGAAIHPHPTLSEAVKEAALGVLDQSIHI